MCSGAKCIDELAALHEKEVLPQRAGVVAAGQALEVTDESIAYTVVKEIDFFSFLHLVCKVARKGMTNLDD